MEGFLLCRRLFAKRKNKKQGTFLNYVRPIGRKEINNHFIDVKETITMKKVFALMMSAVLALTALTGCGGSASQTAKTPEELTQIYADAINQSGSEMVQYNPVISEVKEDDMSAMIVESLGLTAEDMTAFGISMSMMNVKAYGIAAIMPAEGKTDAVKEALQNFIDIQRQSFEQYLADQYEIAKSARLETLSDGTVLMVMCDDSDKVFDAISAAILEG